MNLRLSARSENESFTMGAVQEVQNYATLFLHACHRHCAVAEYQKNLRNAEAECSDEFLFRSGFAEQYGFCPKKACGKQKDRAGKMRMKQKRDDDFRKKKYLSLEKCRASSKLSA